jgi:ActR/RegA family two-component response regulator
MTVVGPHPLLLVDDDREFAEEFAELLGCFGCDVTIAETLSAAQAALLTGRFRFVVVDLGLGEESGLTLAHDCQNKPELRVLLLSGRRLTPTEIASFAGDPPPLLLKPANGAEIMKALGI